MSVIAAVGPVLADHHYPQDLITDTFASLLGDPGRQALTRRLHEAARVHSRHLALTLAEYPALDGFAATNAAFLEHAPALGAAAIHSALDDAGLEPAEVDAIFSTTVTGIAVPSLDARLAADVGLRPDVKRIPLFGLGCAAGAAGIARMHDYLRSAPDEVAVLVSVELCSLTLQRDDPSTANLVAAGLFGDGAAAVVALGAERARRLPAVRPRARVIDSRSHLYPDTLRTMGWDVGPGGLRVVLDAGVPDLVRRHLGADVRSLLAAHGLRTADVVTWVSHPGGPKVIEAIQDALELPPEALELTWRSLAEVGNLSSASVLHVLHDTIDKHPPAGAPGVLMAMGPGFCSEIVLLRWE